jgi:hypothetical protein
LVEKLEVVLVGMLAKALVVELEVELGRGLVGLLAVLVEKLGVV